MLLAAAPVQGQAAKPGLPVGALWVPGAVLRPRGWQLQAGPHPSTSTGRPMRRRCVAIPWERAGRCAPGCASPVISPPRHAALLRRLWNKAKQWGGGRGGPVCTAWSHGAHTAPMCAELPAHVCGCGTAVHPLLLAACPLSVHTRSPVACTACTNVQVGCTFCCAHACKGPLGHVWGRGQLRADWASAVGLSWERCGAGSGVGLGRAGGRRPAEGVG